MNELFFVVLIQMLTKMQTYYIIFDKIRYNSQLESFCCCAMHQVGAKPYKNILRAIITGNYSSQNFGYY
ncbi:hypothetical protein HNR39_003738 [Glaciimonas immobilis]|uniref:Uncharacterized protein n=1 Tax=Glaciimonas immobilis TaxID=728004 RepID=A0A840RYD2_9BURK|nr:hypothetical protein [Glaciimonas immobilis]